MSGKHQINSQVDPISDKRSVKHEATAMNLLEEYENRLKAGENPNPRDYLNRYTGPDEDDFRIELNLATILTVDGTVSRQETHKILQGEKIKSVKEMLLKRLF